MLRSRVALRGIGCVLRKPQYLAAVITGVFLSSSLIMWSLNLDLARYILFEAPITAIDKIRFFSESYSDIFTTFNDVQVLGISIFSFLFGINMAMLIFVIKNHGLHKVPKKSSLAGTAAAVISGGCVACGTSLFAPVAITLGATSGVFLRDLSLWLNLLASILMIYSIYKLGQLAQYISVK